MDLIRPAESQGFLHSYFVVIKLDVIHSLQIVLNSLVKDSIASVDFRVFIQTSREAILDSKSLSVLGVIICLHKGTLVRIGSCF